MNKLRFLKLFMVSLVALATLGCGSSNDFYTGAVSSVDDPSALGGLTFQIHRTADVAAQQVLLADDITQGYVPEGTTYIGFAFFESIGDDGVYNGKWTGWDDRIFTFDAGSNDLTVNVAGVPGSVHYAVVIAYGADKFPIGIIRSPQFNVVNGRDLPVQLHGDDNYSVISLKSFSVADVYIDITGNIVDQANTGASTPIVPIATFSDGHYNIGPIILNPSLIAIAYDRDSASALASYADGYFTGIRAGEDTFSATFAGQTVTPKLIVTDNTSYGASLTFANSDTTFTDGDEDFTLPLELEGTLNNNDSTPITPSYSQAHDDYFYSVRVSMGDNVVNVPLDAANGLLDFSAIDPGNYTVSLYFKEEEAPRSSFVVHNYHGVQGLNPENEEYQDSEMPESIELLFTNGITANELIDAGYSFLYEFTAEGSEAPDHTEDITGDVEDWEGVIPFHDNYLGLGVYKVSLKFNDVELDSGSITINQVP